MALFFTYAHLFMPSVEAIPLVRGMLDRIRDELAERVRLAGLYSGVAGAAWAIEHIAGMHSDFSDQCSGGDLDEIDDYLLDQLDVVSSKHFDLINGLVGIGVYAVSRREHDAAKRLFSAVIRKLIELSDTDEDGVTWPTRPHMFKTEDDRRLFPAGQHNLGVAHGMPAVVSLLAHGVRLGYANEDQACLLRQAAKWMLAQRQTDGISVFPTCIEKRGYSRLAWCYGDSGACMALIAAGRALDDAEVVEAGVDVALRAAQRRGAGATGVIDPTICHGAAGNAHVFARLFNATGNAQFRETAKHWLAECLRLSDSNEGIAGVRCFYPGTKEWNSNPGFLMGASGVGLVLLAAIQRTPPHWDRVLLTDQ